MPISPGQAAAALEQVERTERRTRLSGGYAAASPHLILWGLVWILGYGGCAVVPPEKWGLVWLPLIVVGAIGSGFFGSRHPARAGGGGSGEAVRSALMAVAVGVFIGSVYFVFRPAGTLPYLVFPALIMGLVYSLAGMVARMPRFTWIGASIFVLIMAGYVAAPEWTAAWIALVGGGGLVLGGLWLRKV